MSVLKNAVLYTIAQNKPCKGDIRIRDGVIVEIGHELNGDESETCIDLDGCYVMPGLIDAHAHIGMWEDGLDFEGADGNESVNPITPHLRAIDAVNPFDRCFQEAREGGVTTVATGPGSANVIGGTFLAMKTMGNCVEDMVICDPLAMKIAFGENPKRVYAEQKRSPMTRMATAAMLREALQKAKCYGEKKQKAAGDLEAAPAYDAKCEALLPVLRGEIPLKAHAHRADDIQTALRIAKEFGCRITLDHCTEGYLIADQLAKEKANIILGPLMCDRGKPELKNLTMQAPMKMEKAGIPFAVMSDHPVTATQNLLVTMALAVREGLSEETALRAVTLHPAQIMGLSERIGSIEVGKDADLVAYSHEPLNILAKPRQVWIDGRPVFDGMR